VKRLAIATMALYLASHSVCAETIRAEFIEPESNESIAALTMAVPATHESIVRLNFTDVGQDLFGFGPVYEGAFDRSTNLVECVDPCVDLSSIDSDNGLPSVSFFSDDNPPSTPLIDEGVTQSEFSIRFGTNSFDSLTLSALGLRIEVVGNWVVTVPEPNCPREVWCLILSAVAGLIRTRRKKSNAYDFAFDVSSWSEFSNQHGSWCRSGVPRS
jgi:hypothetical protein